MDSSHNYGYYDEWNQYEDDIPDFHDEDILQSLLDYDDEEVEGGEDEALEDLEEVLKSIRAQNRDLLRAVEQDQAEGLEETTLSPTSIFSTSTSVPAFLPTTFAPDTSPPPTSPPLVTVGPTPAPVSTSTRPWSSSTEAPPVESSQAIGSILLQVGGAVVIVAGVGTSLFCARAKVGRFLVWTGGFMFNLGGRIRRNEVK